MRTTRGACHCGAVRWTLSGDPGSITACNCTVCRRYGALWAYDYEGERIATQGETRAYVRGRTTEFHFCSACGCVVWWRAREQDEAGRRRLAVNVRMAEPEEVADLAIDHFDGLDSFEDLPPSGRQVRDLWA
jgi:hypothetical protein